MDEEVEEKRGTKDFPPVATGSAARLSNLMGIHKALRIIFSEAQRGYAWIKAGNAAFAGASALDVMLGG